MQNTHLPEHGAVLTEASFVTYNGTTFIVGRIHGDKKNRFRDGERVRTSPVVAAWPDGTVDTINTRYLVVPHSRDWRKYVAQ